MIAGIKVAQLTQQWWGSASVMVPASNFILGCQMLACIFTVPARSQLVVVEVHINARNAM